MRIVDLTAGFDLSTILKLANIAETAESVDTAVGGILRDVRERGDQAVCDWTARFDGVAVTRDRLRFTKAEINKHAAAAAPEMVDVLKAAIDNVRAFHEQ